MLLIISHTEDYTVDYVANILNKSSLPFFRLNTDLLHEYDYVVEVNSRIHFELSRHREFQSIWFRRVKLPQLRDLTDVQNYIGLDYQSLLFGYICSLQVERIISDPYSIYRAENKIFQLKTALNVGFKVPKTVLTNSKEVLRKFIDHQPSIIKPIRSGKFTHGNDSFLIYTNRIEANHLLEDDLLTPAIYQQEIIKEYEIRVTVVGEKVFASKVNSQSDEETVLDWRRKHLKFEAYTLPFNITDLCIKLIKELQLSFGAIDLIYSTTGEYYFLEINPNGQWVWIELDTGQKISQALINYLYNV
jgi:hypothetical protein